MAANKVISRHTKAFDKLMDNLRRLKKNARSRKKTSSVAATLCSYAKSYSPVRFTYPIRSEVAKHHYVNREDCMKMLSLKADADPQQSSQITKHAWRVMKMPQHSAVKCIKTNGHLNVKPISCHDLENSIDEISSVLKHGYF